MKILKPIKRKLKLRRKQCKWILKNGNCQKYLKNVIKHKPSRNYKKWLPTGFENWICIYSKIRFPTYQMILMTS